MAWKYPDLVLMLPQYTGWPEPPKSNANYAFILSAISQITDKSVLLLPCGVLTTANKAEAEIRKGLIELNLIDAVITLPDKMFESTSIPTCILIINKKKKTRKIEMIDMRNKYEIETRNQNGQFGGASHEGRTYHKEIKVFTDAQIHEAVKATFEYETIAEFCKATEYEEIKNNDYILTPSRYIESPDAKVSHRAYQDIVNDYNRIVKEKNAIKFTINETAAQRIGLPIEIYQNRVDVKKAFEAVGFKAEKENYMSFTKSALIRIDVNTKGKDKIPDLIAGFIHRWASVEMALNDEQNRLLAEFRDALLPDLLSGKIEIKG